MANFCEWCMHMGKQETLPLGMCQLHQHAPDMLFTLSLILNWYKLANMPLNPSAKVGPDDRTVKQMIEDVLRKAEGA